MKFLVLVVLVLTLDTYGQRRPRRQPIPQDQIQRGDSIEKWIHTPLPSLFVFVDTIPVPGDHEGPINWGDLADSTARSIDSLIKAGELYTIQINEIEQNGSQKTRKYYVDTSNQVVCKAILDTAFSDHFAQSFAQVVIYFYKGVDFRICYLIEKEKFINRCDTYDAFTPRNKFMSTPGDRPYSPVVPIVDNFRPPALLPNNWSPDLIDSRMRLFVERDIEHVKFIQRRRGSDF